jgi:hypothetical protein
LADGLARINDIPTSQIKQIQEDMLIDYVISLTKSEEGPQSEQDLELFIRENLPKWIEVSQADIAGDIYKRLAKACLFYLKSGDPNVEALTTLLKKSLKVQEDKAPERNILRHGDTLVVRCPTINGNNRGHVDNLATILRWACFILGTDPSKTRIVEDGKLGNECHLPGAIGAWMNALVSSKQSIKGMYPGDTIKVSDKIKLSLPEILAAVHLLRVHSSLIRKKPDVRGKDGKTTRPYIVNPEILRDLANQYCGLKADSTPPFIKRVVKGVFAEVTKRGNYMPGVWIHALKERLGSKTTEGALAELGWIPVVPTYHKIVSTLSSRLDESKKKIISLDFSDEGSDASFVEIRAATILLLPMVTGSEKARDQYVTDSLKFSNEKIVAYYKEHAAIVDSLNRAFAIKTAVLGGSKTALPVHYENARNNLLSITANKDFTDGNGKRYLRLIETPENFRRFLKDFFYFEVGRKRAYPDEEGSQMETEETTQQSGGSPESSETPMETSAEENSPAEREEEDIPSSTSRKPVRPKVKRAKVSEIDQTSSSQLPSEKFSRAAKAQTPSGSAPILKFFEGKSREEIIGMENLPVLFSELSPKGKKVLGNKSTLWIDFEKSFERYITLKTKKAREDNLPILRNKASNTMVLYRSLISDPENFLLKEDVSGDEMED